MFMTHSLLYRHVILNFPDLRQLSLSFRLMRLHPAIEVMSVNNQFFNEMTVKGFSSYKLMIFVTSVDKMQKCFDAKNIEEFKSVQ